MTPIDSVGLLIATLLGALVASALGWLDSDTPFQPKKFYPSLIRGAIAAAIAYAIAYTGFVGEVNLFTYLGVFFAGGGWDALGNRASGIIKPDKDSTTDTAPSTETTTSVPTAIHTSKILLTLKYHFFRLLPYVI